MKLSTDLSPDAVNDRVNISANRTMNYEPSYSRTQIHFISQPPQWLSLLDSKEHVESILDLGAGGGRNSVFLRKLYPDAQLTALDISLVRCATCRQVSDAEVICGNGIELPFETNSFDLIVSTQVIEHVPDDQTFVSEIKRVLMPRGLALISSVIKMPLGWYFYRNRNGEWVLDPTHLREYGNVQEFVSLFRKQFRVKLVTTDQFRFSPIRLIYRFLVKLAIIRDPNPRFFSTTRLGALFETMTIPIPRYRCVTVLVEHSISDFPTL